MTAPMPRHGRSSRPSRACSACRPAPGRASWRRSPSACWRWACGKSLVRWNAIPPYILPGPLLIGQTLIADWATLSGSLWITLRITFMALAAAVIVGVSLAVLFTQSKWLEMSLLPYAVILQVTPIVAIAPLIIIWAGDINLSLLICAWIVAFFPILSNTILGLNSADHNLDQLVPALWRDAAGRRCAISSCRPRCPTSWPA